MTCIVGVVEKHRVYLGADSAGVGGYSSLTIRKDKKVFRNDDFVIAGTSSFRMIQLLRYAFVTPVYGCDANIDKFMATTFVDAIRECFKEGGFAQKSAEKESGGSFLVGFQGRLFEIWDDYQVAEAASGYGALGCGAEVALGSLFATPDMQAEKRIELALKASESHNAGVRAPFYIESV